MATIGSAVLQIIPSLRGVSEAIEKEVAGKVVNVTVAPQVEKAAVERVGKQAKEGVEKHTKQVKVEPKVDQAAAQKAGKQAGKTVSDEMASSVKSSAGKEVAKAVVDGIADGVKREMPRGGVAEVFVDGLADGIKQGIDGVGIGGQVVTTIGTGIRSGNLGGTIKDAVVPAIKGIGDEIRSSTREWAGNIGNSLRSGDIQGATTEIGNTVRNATDLISEIGSTFGLQLDGVREFGNTAATTLSDVGVDVQNVITAATGINTTFNTAGDLLEKVLPGKAGAGAAGIARALGAVAVPAWLLYLVAQDRSGRTWGNGDPVSAIPTPSDFTPGQRSTNEILYGPYIGPFLDKTLGITPPNMPSIPGGGLPGAQRERRGYGAGGYTGSMPIDQIAGVVHGGEYVINATATNGIENAFPGLLDYLNNKGALPGYQGGGKVQLGNISGAGITTGEQQSMWDAVRGKFPGAVLSSATRSVMTEGHPDFHNAGRAIDISGPGMGAIASWIASTYPDSLELIHSPFGHNIKNGKDVGDGTSFYGAGLMAAHRNHVHWALGKSAAKAAMPSMTATLGADSPATSSPASIGDTGASSSPQSVITLASSFSGLAATAGDGLSKISPVISPDGKTQSLDKIGSAVGQFASGQVGSALSAFGIGDSPGWLKGISTLANGIKIGGAASPIGAAGGDSAGAASMVPSIAPLASAATSAIGGFLGSPAAPVSQVNYNIQTTDIEPAYLASQRNEKERAATNLARY